MAVQFSPTAPRPQERCVVCQKRLSEDVVAHDNWHPIHLKCLQAWARASATCPECRQNSLLPGHTRTVHWLDPDLVERALFALGDHVFLIPGSIWGSIGALVITETPETKVVCALGLLAGVVTTVVSTRILPRSTLANWQIPITLATSFSGSFTVVASLNYFY